MRSRRLLATLLTLATVSLLTLLYFAVSIFHPPVIRYVRYSADQRNITTTLLRWYSSYSSDADINAMQENVTEETPATLRSTQPISDTRATMTQYDATAGSAIITKSTTMPTVIHKSQGLPSKPTSASVSLSKYSTTGKCTDNMCSEFLSAVEHYRFSRCQHLSKSPPDTHPQCHFMDGRGRDPVALVSIPGAGCTWVRSLLEGATGICTGAIYCDQALRLGGYVGEFIHSGSVLVVKTHTSDHQWKGEKIEKRNSEDAMYSSAIFLIRNPFDNFVAERNRVTTLEQLGGYWPPPPGKIDNSHTHLIDKKYFGDNPQWDKVIHALAERWKKTIVKWYLHPATARHRIMLVRFEDVKKDKLNEVKRMLEFLHVPYNESTLAEKLEGEFNTNFKREHEEYFEHYTIPQKKYINNLILETIQMLKQHDLDQLFGLHEYIANV